MSRFRVVGAVIAGLAAWYVSFAALGYVLMQAMIWIPSLAPVLFFPSGRFPVVSLLIIMLPPSILGSVVSTKVWGRAKEFTITLAIGALLWGVSAAETSGLTLSSATPFAVQLACAAICLAIDQRPQTPTTKGRRPQSATPVKHRPEPAPGQKAENNAEAEEFKPLLDQWLDKAKKEQEQKQKEETVTMKEDNKAYRLDRRLGVLNPGASVTKEVTLGYWDGELRLDIRKWENLDLGKGISLTEDEVRRLREILDATLFGT